MRKKTRKIAAVLAASAVSVVAIVPATANADPKRGQGYLSDVPSGGAGESECNGANYAALNTGQQKKCDAE